MTAAVIVCTTDENAGDPCCSCTPASRPGSNPFRARANWYRAITLWKDSTHANRLVSSSTLTMSRPIRPRLASVVSSSMLASPSRVRCATSPT